MTKAAYLCGFVAGFDSTSQFFVFGSIRDQLAGGDISSASWILTIAGIVGSVALLQAGRLCDRFGHNRVLVGAAFLMGFGSLLAAVAPTLALLVAARGIQAAAYASLGVSSISILVRDTPTERLASALGSWGFWTALSGVSGPIVSSLLDQELSWRWVFALEALIAVVLIALAWPGWHQMLPRKEVSSVDVIGTVLVAGGLALVVLALLEGNDWGWLSLRTLGAAAVGLGLVAVVVARSRTHPDPVIPLEPFRNRGFVVGALAQSVATLGFFAMWLALLQYMTEVWDYSVFRSGLLLTMMPGGMAVISKAVGRYCDQRGFRRVVVAGALITATGFSATALLIDSEPRVPLILPAILTAGVGMAMVLPPTSTAATRTLLAHQVGTGTAIMQTLSRVAGGLGPAAVVALLGTGVAGDPAVHRLSIWLVVVTMLVAAGLAANLRDDAVRGFTVPQLTDDPPKSQ